MIDVENRPDLGVDDFQFLLAFKKQGEPVYFRMIHDSTKCYSKNESCLLLDNEDEYGFMRTAFKRYQRKGYGIFFVVNSGGQRKESITALTAQFGDADFGKEEVGVDSEGKPVFRYRTQDEVENYKQEFLKKLLQFELEPSIIVETKNGFHFYWLLKRGESHDLRLFKPIQEAIIRKFNSDPNITNLDRILRLPNYLHLKDPADPFLVRCIKFDPQLRYTQQDLATSLDCDLNNLKSREKSVEIIKVGNKVKYENNTVPLNNAVDINIPKSQNAKEFDTLEEVIDFLRKQDMFQILGISAQPGKAFNCLFHHDEHPSAVIVNNQGQYKYFCNSPFCEYHSEKGLDIIDLISKLKSLNFYGAIKYLCEKYNIHIKNTDTKWVEEQKAKYIRNIELLYHPTFLEQHKSLNRVIRSGTKVLAEINQIGLEHITFEHLSHEGQSVFFFSNRYLANRLRVSLKLTNQYINLFCVLGLIKKLPKSEVPEEFRERAKIIAEKTGQRQIHFYTVLPLEEVAAHAEQIAKKMLDYGYSTIRSISKAMIENLLGKTFATSIYLTPVKESLHSKTLKEEIEKFMLEEINRKGYVIMDDILRKNIYVNGKKINNEIKYVQFKRLIPVMIKKYGFIYRKANKDLRERFGLNGYNYVLYMK